MQALRKRRIIELYELNARKIYLDKPVITSIKCFCKLEISTEKKSSANLVTKSSFKTQLILTCSNSTIKTLEKGVKYGQS